MTRLLLLAPLLLSAPLAAQETRATATAKFSAEFAASDTDKDGALTRAEVAAAYAWAREQGQEVLHEPQVFPQYHARHYAAFWVDPHGFKIEVVSFEVVG